MKAGWKTVKLGEVARYDKVQGIHIGLPYVGLEHIESGTRKFIGSRSDMEVQSSSFLFNPHHVLYGRLRPYLRKVLVPDFAGHCSTEIFPILPSSDLDRSYLSYWLISEFTTSAIDRLCNGARMPRANMEQVLELEIPLPPLADQKRIVALLDEAFAGIDEAKAKAEAAQRASAKIFESQVGLSFKENSAWKEATLSDLGETLTGTTPPTANPEYYGEYIPFVKPADFNEDGTLVVDNHGLSKEGMKVARVTNPDSVLMVCIGATIGKTGYTTTRITTNQQINSFTPGSLVNFKFAYYQMISSSFQKEVFARANQATMPMISKSKWSQISLRFPNNYDTQVKVAERLSELKFLTGKLSEIADRKVTALNEIKSSILAQAFAGELTA